MGEGKKEQKVRARSKSAARSTCSVDRLEPRRLFASGLTGQYFDDQNFTGFKREAIDAGVNAAWSNTATPAGLTDKDSFSVRWTGTVKPTTTDTYRFRTAADGAVRLWVDGKCVIDRWTIGNQTDTSAAVTLAAGVSYDLRLDYRDTVDASSVTLQWNRNGATTYATIPSGNLNTLASGVRGEYFDNADLTASKTVRTDAGINFDWGDTIPSGTAVTNKDTWSTRWSGFVKPDYSQAYTFTVQADDGVRLWVDGNLVIDKWQDQAATFSSKPVTLEGGKRYDLQMEYYDNTQGSAAKLSWSSAGQTGGNPQIVPASNLFASKPAWVTQNVPVYVFAGQSNMVGARGNVNDLSADYRKTQTNVLWAGEQYSPVQWGTMTAPTETGQAPNSFGPELAAARTIANGWDFLGNNQPQIAVVKYAISNTDLYDQWNVNNTGSYYYQMLARARDAAAKLGLQHPGTTGYFAGFFWMQGENDSNDQNKSSAYYQNLTNLKNKVKTDLFGGQDRPFIYGRTNVPLGAYNDTVVAAQRQFDAVAYAGYVETSSFSRYDGDFGLHFDSKGLIQLGEAMGNEFFSTFWDPNHRSVV